MLRATFTIGDASGVHREHIMRTTAGYFDACTVRVCRGMYKGKAEPSVEVCVLNVDNCKDFEANAWQLAAHLRDDFKQECVLLVLDTVEAHLV